LTTDNKSLDDGDHETMAARTALITGATGFVGKALVDKLAGELNWPISVLSRDPERARAKLGVTRAYPWEPEKGLPPSEALRDAGIVVHLAGETVSGRWNQAKKDRISSSRIAGTRHLVEALAQTTTRPQVMISASAVGYYGDRGDEVLEESSAPGTDFLADVCVGWEQEACKAEELGIRVVTLRTGLVLGPGGVLAQMVPAFRMGAGGRIGNGKQWTPWIHLGDLIGLILWAS